MSVKLSVSLNVHCKAISSCIFHLWLVRIRYSLQMGLKEDEGMLCMPSASHKQLLNRISPFSMRLVLLK
jgi:hypothetical protein